MLQHAWDQELGTPRMITSPPFAVACKGDPKQTPSKHTRDVSAPTAAYCNNTKTWSNVCRTTAAPGMIFCKGHTPWFALRWAQETVC